MVRTMLLSFSIFIFWNSFIIKCYTHLYNPAKYKGVETTHNCTIVDSFLIDLEMKVSLRAYFRIYYVESHRFFFKKKYFIYLFLERGKWRRKRGRETSMCGCLCTIPIGVRLGSQPRHVPWLGINLETLWFAGWCSIHWATPARAESHRFFLCIISVPILICFPHWEQ